MRQKGVPLINQSYIYIGEDSSSFKKGNTYKVIETGQHWFKEFGFCIWMTNEENPTTKDTDYGTSMGVDDFNDCFWKP